LSVAAAILSWLPAQAFGAECEELLAELVDADVLLPAEVDVWELMSLELDPVPDCDVGLEAPAVALLSPLL
jgi:hypothetical protein